MKKLTIVLFAFMAHFNLGFGQVQFFAGGSAGANWGYQLGMPVDIQLDSKFAFTTGLFYVANKESDTYNPTVIRRETTGSTGGLFSFGVFIEDYFNAKTYSQNYLSVPLALKFTPKADKTKSSWLFEAGLNAVYTLNGKVKNHESSRIYSRGEDPSSAKVRDVNAATVPFSTMDIQAEGIKQFNAEWRLAVGVRLRRNVQLSLRVENTLENNYSRSNGFKPLVNRHTYLSVNVPIYTIKAKSSK
jgi:hypothetical protein